MNHKTQENPGFSEYVETIAQVIVSICALLPFGLFVAALGSLAREDWLKFPVVWLALAFLLALSFLWYCLATKTKRPVLLAGIFACVAIMAGLKTDWVVMTRYDYGGKVSLGGQALARSPFWSPPRPGKSATGAKSWKDHSFPDLGKDHMLLGEPWLEVAWVAVLARMLFYTVAPFVVLSGLLTVYEQGRRRTRSRRRPLADE